MASEPRRVPWRYRLMSRAYRAGWNDAVSAMKEHLRERRPPKHEHTEACGTDGFYICPSAINEVMPSV